MTGSSVELDLLRVGLNGLCCVCLVTDSFRVKIWSLEKEYVRVHVSSPLDRGDGSLLVRYRLYESSSKDLTIEVLYQDKPVASSPYTLKGKGFFLISIYF